MRGRTEALSEDDRRICHDLARVVRVRSWTLLLLDALFLPAMTAYATGTWSRSSATPAWLVVPLALLLAVGATETWLRAETRAPARFLVSHELSSPAIADPAPDEVRRSPDGRARPP